MQNEDYGTLYLIPTPVGNLKDITHRALETLEAVDLIACEDTRHSGQLLAHFGIKKKKISYFEHNESARVPRIIEMLQDGQSIAVISDGGSPGLSDPAYRIVSAAVEEGIRVEALPGATAAIPALTASGLPTDRFFFEGFLPVKSGKRKTRLQKLAEFPHTIIIYESVHRIKKSLNAIAEVFGNRQICVAREISKMYEEYTRGTAIEVALEYESKTAKGEFVIIIAGNKDVEK
ncbi:MAG: 16S rRNA (cytidine(1402)-2'-O)-methyltransferase [candidate division Zixibacteria bacterium]|nr:16S rRNA (cytidine(1402)-2'-O)-methyltransferase [candidate division Zixibacteria bacterium]